MNRTLVAIVIVLAFSPPIFAQSLHDLIRSKAVETSTAIVDGKYGVAADLIYPELVELIGGRDVMISLMEERGAVGAKIVSVDVGQPTDPRRSGDKLFSIVPTQTTLQGRKRMIQNSYLLAISTDMGTTWTFLEGAGITPKRLASLLLELPSDLKLPERTPARVVEPE